MTQTPQIPLNYGFLSEAVKFYRLHGFEYIEVPWVVPAVYTKGLARTQAVYPVGDGDTLLTNGEQAFIFLLDQGVLELGKRYQTITPCFREKEQYSEWFLPYFMKLELIQTDLNGAEDLLSIAAQFFQSLGIPAKSVSTAIGTDLVWEGIELGSYGTRAMKLPKKECSWSYGTGIAEPRLSNALKHAKLQASPKQ